MDWHYPGKDLKQNGISFLVLSIVDGLDKYPQAVEAQDASNPVANTSESLILAILLPLHQDEEETLKTRVLLEAVSGGLQPRLYSLGMGKFYKAS